MPKRERLTFERRRKTELQKQERKDRAELNSVPPFFAFRRGETQIFDVQKGPSATRYRFGQSPGRGERGEVNLSPEGMRFEKNNLDFD